MIAQCLVLSGCLMFRDPHRIRILCAADCVLLFSVALAPLLLTSTLVKCTVVIVMALTLALYLTHGTCVLTGKPWSLRTRMCFGPVLGVLILSTIWGGVKTRWAWRSNCANSAKKNSVAGRVKNNNIANQHYKTF